MAESASPDTGTATLDKVRRERSLIVNGCWTRQGGRAASSGMTGLAICMALACLLSGTSAAAQPRPPADLNVVDHPNDAGTLLDLSWKLSPDDAAEAKSRVLTYRILRKIEPSVPAPEQSSAAQSAPIQNVPADSARADSTAGPGEFKQVIELPAGTSNWSDVDCRPGVRYRYAVQSVGADGSLSELLVSGSAVSPVTQFFDRSRLGLAVLLALVSAGMIGMILYAHTGAKMTLRTIPALKAVDEAVGRATEMGKNILFVPGVQDINEMMTVAGIIVLGRVAETAAEYDCPLQVPTARSLVMTACRETVAAACFAAGRPENYDENSVYYLADEQFAYVAGVTGMMVREKPAACFYFGQFYAESLFLAETGNSIGALQIAGTAETTQLPFFVAACDYTLIGEEFFAASAYLSGAADQMGSVKGQDLGKVLAGGLIILGVGLATVQVFVSNEGVRQMLAFLQQQVLGG